MCILYVIIHWFCIMSPNSFVGIEQWKISVFKRWKGILLSYLICDTLDWWQFTVLLFLLSFQLHYKSLIYLIVLCIWPWWHSNSHMHNWHSIFSCSPLEYIQHFHFESIKPFTVICQKINKSINCNKWRSFLFICQRQRKGFYVNSTKDYYSKIHIVIKALDKERKK